MIPLLTRQAARALDADAIERLGVPGLELMEHAGRGAHDAIIERFAGRLGQVAIIAGPGQNGGDGWVVARHLIDGGHSPRLALIGDESKLKGDALTNLERLRDMGATLVALDDALEGCTLVVDALFGTGLDREVEGVFAQAVAAINGCDAPCVALDLPSGIDANTGAVLGTAVDAVLTVGFAALKRGLVQHPGAQHAGEVLCVSIGVPGPTTSDAFLIEPGDVADWVPPRAAVAHKGSAGHLLIVAGSPGKSGAGLLAGLGALRMGAGLVTLAPRGKAAKRLEAKLPELMTERLPDDLEEAVVAATALASTRDAVVVGPGLGVDETGAELARRLGMTLEVPVLLDADALTAFGTDITRLTEAAGPRVLTPHPGEAGRLLGISSADVQADRYKAAARIAELSGAVVVLKGAGTIVASPEGALRVCDRGTPALATAGTGDVLSGVVGSLLLTCGGFDAAAAGVYLHAVAGELAAVSDRGLLASEVADGVPVALESCRAC